MAKDDFRKAFFDLTSDRGMMYEPQLMEEVEKLQESTLEKWGKDGKKLLGEMKNAVVKYPDQSMKEKIVRLCDAEEMLLAETVRKIAAKYNVQMPQQQGPMMTQQQMQLFQMASETLTPEQKAFMQNAQRKMMSGQMPTPDDQRQMLEIQQHVIAYVATMSQAMGIPMQMPGFPGMQMPQQQSVQRPSPPSAKPSNQKLD